MSNFQSQSKKTGDKFEQAIIKDLTNDGHTIIIQHKFYPDIGIEIDLETYSNSEKRFEKHEYKGGEPGANKRPGAKRTDNVKKAIANGALLKTIEPDAYYVVYFSEQPDPNSSSEKMINAALKNKIIDEVRYKYCAPIDFDNSLFSVD